MGGQRHASAALPRGKRPRTHCTGSWMSGKGRSGQMRKMSSPLGFDPRTVQPVASWYTDYAILASASQYHTFTLIQNHYALKAGIIYEETFHTHQYFYGGPNLFIMNITANTCTFELVECLD